MSLFTFLSTLNLALGGLVFLLGFIIFRENPGQRLNRVVALMLFFGGLGSVLAALSFLASGPRPAAGATPDLFQSLSYLWEFFFPTLFLFASIFPEERAFARMRPSRFGRLWVPGFAALVFAPHVFHFGLVLLFSVWRPELGSHAQSGMLRYFSSVLGMGAVLARLFLYVHQALFSLVNLGFGLASMVLLFDSYRRARVPRLRQQLGVIAVGLSACLVLYSFATSIPTLLNLRIPEGLRSGLAIAALTLGPGSITYSVVRYKFLDAKLLARRGILYALGSAALVGLYLLVVSRLRPLLGSLSRGQAQVVEPVLLVFALALFQPAIARLEALVDQIFLKDPADYRNVLRQLGRDLQTTIDLDALLTRTVSTLSDALLLRVAHVVVRTAEGLATRTGAGVPLSPAALARLQQGLPRLQGGSVRLSDGIEGLSAEEHAWLAGLGVALVVPLRWRDELVGALLLGDKLTGIPWTSEDVSLVTSLASQVSVSLQNALLLRDRVAVARFEQELDLARQIQRTSLLSEFPPVPRCDVHVIYDPSKAVGGDFYDLVPTADGGHLIAIADVSGKGMPAALLSAMLQAALRTQAESGATLREILRNINILLYRSTTTGQFATFFLARLDGADLRLTFSNAGHNWPVVLRAGGEKLFLDRGGTILGILENADYEEGHVGLVPGDRVVLYTDGISEATNARGEQFGEQRLYDVVQAQPPGLCAREVAEAVLAEVRSFLDGLEPQDDITLLVLRVLERSPVASEPRTTPETVGAL